MTMLRALPPGARGGSAAAFGRGRIPPLGVARRALGAARHFHHGLLVFVLLATAAATGVSAQDASEEAIRRIVAGQVAAWNAGDGTAYAEHLAPDASFTNIFGVVMYGRSAFAERHAQILATFYKGTTKHHAIRRIRFVTPDVALVDIDNEVRGVKTMPRGIVLPADGVVKTQLMEVFVRRAGRWWVEAYHNVDVKPSR